MHANFFAVCSQVAETSDDPNTQVGCLFINNSNEIIAKGANTLVAGCTNTKERTTRPAKYSWLEHAERNAIYSAARTLMPCVDCARALIQCGASKVVVASRPNLDDARWGSQFRLTLEMFDDVGFQYIFAAAVVNAAAKE